MKRYRFKKIIMFIALFAIAILVFTAIVMGLWNAILPVVIGVKTITYLQAMGILVLSKILFGGFRGRCGGGPGRHWKNKIEEKMRNMTPEEREKFKDEWRMRCGGRWGMQGHTPAASSNE
ncbi:MAG: hypothetical protein JSU03_11140 [Bacteroidetes bacterium]|nr:hypothetical protein [Bacteroidota bacterium]MBS1757825.1 hypothetical protein [Bacteroidota bacterium]